MIVDKETGVLVEVTDEDVPESGIFEIPEYVTRIGERAFENCNALKEVKIGSNVLGVGNKAFYSCEMLEKLTLPDTLVEYERSSIAFCRKLKHIIVVDANGEETDFDAYCADTEALLVEGRVLEEIGGKWGFDTIAFGFELSNLLEARGKGKAPTEFFWIERSFDDSGFTPLFTRLKDLYPGRK